MTAALVPNASHLRAADPVQHRKHLPKTFGPRSLRMILPWLENFWHTQHRFPFIDEWMGQFHLTKAEVESILVNPLFKRSCHARGIDRDFWERGLSERQAATVALLSNIGDGKTVDQKLAQLGVTYEELDGWYKIPEFARIIGERTNANLGNLDPEAYAAISRGIKKGNPRFVEMYLKLTNQAETPEAINLKRAMRMIEDTVRRHVSDPVILQAIADEFNEIRGEL